MPMIGLMELNIISGFTLHVKHLKSNKSDKSLVEKTKITEIHQTILTTVK